MDLKTYIREKEMGVVLQLEKKKRESQKKKKRKKNKLR